ncbi:MAG TPA: DUF2723 domain-containing protein [Burkholderiales bacterium]|nr:DUF2723 domain-containing protein [Burkholderiales bacterium]
MQPSQERFRPSGSDWKEAGLVGTALLALYALTSPRTVAMEDDSLFVLSSYFLGIEHPPGFPLFTLIGHLFTYLPFGSVAYRVHLASALFGALSCAALWLCARALIGARLPAYLAALALGLSPVFWSQSIIAEVYTLNLLFFLGLAYLGLRACPPGAQAPAGAAQGAVLPWMALLFGLSLSNHWPLMLLVAPAFAILLWPLRGELFRRAGLLTWLVMLGLLPYAWMVYRSWLAIPISFYGPLETLTEIWFFVSRAGYADTDQSLSVTWLDRVKFVRFFGGQLLEQFAVLGTLLAAIGFAVQWRMLGRRVAAFLTVAFLMPSVVLILLLGFDYSSITKHVFHVYPLPSYAVGALWLGLGFAWLVERYRLRPAAAAAAGAVVAALILAVGVRTNVLTDHEWGARYGRTLLGLLPKNAVVFARGEADLGTMAYFHLIENVRPDITLYQTKGLILGNRLLHPVRTEEATRQRILREAMERQTDPVISTMETFTGYAHRDRWLYAEVDKSSRDTERVTLDIPEEALQFFEQSVLGAKDPNAWIAFFQAELRRRYAELTAQFLPRSRPPDARTARHLELLANDFHGALGIAQGLMHNAEGYSAGAVAAYLERARELMPSDVVKEDLARYFLVRGGVRLDLRDQAGAIGDFETALSVWPVPQNPALRALRDLYGKAGDAAALTALEARVKRPRGPR